MVYIHIYYYYYFILFNLINVRQIVSFRINVPSELTAVPIIINNSPVWFPGTSADTSGSESSDATSDWCRGVRTARCADTGRQIARDPPRGSLQARVQPFWSLTVQLSPVTVCCTAVI